MWLILSLTNSLTSALQNAYYKRASIQLHPLLVAWSVLVVSSILYLPLFAFGIPKLDAIFWVAVGARLIVDSFAFGIYITGVQKAPLSLTIPMLSLSPLVSILTFSLINHISPSAIGLIGVVATVVGLYLLNFDHDTKHLLSPFKAIASNKGVLYVAIAGILWSLVNSCIKLGIDHSSSLFYTAFFQLLWAICFTPVAYLSDKKGFTSLFTPGTIKKLLPGGTLDTVQVLTQNIAYTMANPVYVAVIGRSDILFSSLFGWLFFKEKIEKHVIPILIIVAGIMCITLAQK